MWSESWRIVILSMVYPVVEHLAPFLKDMGHEPVAAIAARRPRREGDDWRREQTLGLVNDSMPELDVVFPSSKDSLASLFRAYQADLVLCWGYPWKLPREALEAPRLGCVNHHPGPLPRLRGPSPIAWAVREGDTEYGLTWHRMDAEFDTGAILAQASIPALDDEWSMFEIGPRLGAAALQLLPRVFERIAAGDPGDPQPADGGTYAGFFGADYATVDFSRTAREVHNQVRAWALTMGLTEVPGPIAQFDGQRVRLLRSSLVEQPEAVARVECADGPLWILEHEPAPMT